MTVNVARTAFLPLDRGAKVASGPGASVAESSRAMLGLAEMIRHSLEIRGYIGIHVDRFNPAGCTNQTSLPGCTIQKNHVIQCRQGAAGLAIHSVDRPSLCEALAKEIAKQGRGPLLFVEINTGAEPQKAGVLPQDTDDFLKACRERYGLTISGLMCIPPPKKCAFATMTELST